MRDFYEILAESLTRKYITEAWSDSMPDWMKGRLQATATGIKGWNLSGGWNLSDEGADKMLRSRTFKKAYRYAIAKGSDASAAHAAATQAYFKHLTGSAIPFTPDYQSPRKGPDAYRLDDTKTLFAEFQNKGIDLTNPNIKFIETTPPTSSKDSKVQSPNIPIWSIPIPNSDNHQIYAKGINDLEKLFRNIDAGTYREVPFKDVSVKKLAELCDNFCYIDGSTIEYQNPYKKINRNEYKHWANDEGKGLIRNAEQAGIGLHDKSGYIVIPIADKYVEELKRIHATKWAFKLSEVEDALHEVYNQYIHTMKSLSFDDIVDSSKNTYYGISRQAQQFMDWFRGQIHQYRSILDLVDNAKANSSNDDEFIDYLISHNFASSIKSIKYDVDKAVDRYFGVYTAQSLNF